MVLCVEADEMDSKPGGVYEVFDDEVRSMVLAPDSYPSRLDLDKVKEFLRS